MDSRPPLCLVAKTAATGEAEGSPRSWLPDLGFRRKRERFLTWAAAMGSMSRAVRGNTRKCIAVFIAVACGEHLSPFIPRTPITRLLSNGLTWPHMLVVFLLVMRLIGCVRQHPAPSHLVLCLQPFNSCGHSAPFLSMTQNPSMDL